MKEINEQDFLKTFGSKNRESLEKEVEDLRKGKFGEKVAELETKITEVKNELLNKINEVRNELIDELNKHNKRINDLVDAHNKVVETVNKLNK